MRSWICATVARRALLLANTAPRDGEIMPEPVVTAAPSARPYHRMVCAKDAVPPIDQDTEIMLRHFMRVMQPMYRLPHPKDEVSVGVL